MRRLTDLLKGLLALAATAALLVAVPAALVAIAGWPVDDLVAAATDELQSDNTRVAEVLANGLAIIAWLAWVQVAWAIVVETVAVVRGRAAGRAMVMPGLQPLAFKLVATTTLLVSALTPDPASARGLPQLSAPSAVAYEAMGEAGPVWQADPFAMPTGEVRVDHGNEDWRTYRVAAGDTFWSLAERFYGDGLRWRELRAHNAGQIQPDGTALSEATEELRAGWILVLPAEAVLPLTADTPADAAGTDAAGMDAPDAASTEGEVVVEDGDHFWAIAEGALAGRLGRAPTDDEVAPFWVELVDDNRDRLLPPNDPDLIYPGQQFTIPLDPGRAADPPGPPAGEPEVDPPGEEPPPGPDEGDLPAPPGGSDDAVPPGVPDMPPPPLDGIGSAPGSDDATPPPASTPPPPTDPATPPSTVAPPPPSELPPPRDLPPSTGALSPGAGPPGTAPAPELAAIASEVEPFPPASEDGGETSDPADELPVAIVMAAVSGLGLLGAGVWRIVARRRTQAIGSRRPGTVPLFKPPPGAEAFLVRTSDDRALSDLDRGLRALAAAIGPNSAMPDLVGVVIEPATIILLLDSPHRSPPAPFTVDEDGRVWRLDRAADPGPGSHRAEAPFPALVTVGHTERSQLLLNLEHAGVVNVSGRGPEDVIDTMATMALELATSPVADTLEILCVGFGRELAALERVTAVDSLAEAVERIETHAATVAALVAEVEVSGPAGRAAGIGGDTWTPLVVFDVASGPGQTGELIRAAGETVDSGVTAVVTAAGGSRWSIRVSGTEISLPFLGVTRRRRNLTLAERRDLVRTIGDAARPASIQARNLVTDITANAASHDPASQPAVPMVPAVLAAPAAPPWEVRIVVRVLGPLSVEKMEGAPVRFGRGSTAEFVAYLSHHRRGVSIDAAMEALWPNAEPKRPWINNLSSDARKALGTDGEGRFLLPRMTGDGLFRLSPLVGTDLERFEQLVDHASGLPPAAAVEILKEALGLVAGPPFGGMSSSWALLEGVATHAMLAVDEAARALATIALDQLDDPIRADWATRQGLLANPRSNELHLLRLRSVLARGSNESAAESVFQRYRSIVLGDDDQPEGGSELDPRIVELYSSFRRTRPANWVGQRAAAGTWPGGDHHPPMPGPDRRLGTGGQPPHPAS